MEKVEGLKSKLEELEDEYSNTKYNKATNKHLGILRAKIAKTKKDIIEGSKGKKGKGFFVKKTGDVTVALIGFPSAGKSTLINAISNVKSKTASYAFTTTEIIPGMLIYNHAHIQVFDLPGLIENAHLGVGGGRSVLSAARISDLILFVIDATNPAQIDMLMHEFSALNIYVNVERPDVHVLDSKGQGLRIEVNRSLLTDKELQVIFFGLGMPNSIVRIRSKINEDELISLLAGRSIYIRAIVALNKIDLVKGYEKVADDIRSRYNIEVFPVSMISKRNVDPLIKGVYNNLGIITVYLRHRLDKAEAEPLILKKGSTVGEAAKKLHTDIADELKSAYVEGVSVKFKNQRVGINHVLEEGDVLTFIKNK
ncbi:small GTP-binding protein [mine drainage metagenome]|uniref:Small GTP-binding protein n=1 Tax=mine drainage metagenome TaxID=410659 RepID=T1BX98_9ZZZZ